MAFRSRPSPDLSAGDVRLHLQQSLVRVAVPEDVVRAQQIAEAERLRRVEAKGDEAGGDRVYRSLTKLLMLPGRAYGASGARSALLADDAIALHRSQIIEPLLQDTSVDQDRDDLRQMLAHACRYDVPAHESSHARKSASSAPSEAEARAGQGVSRELDRSLPRVAVFLPQMRRVGEPGAGVGPSLRAATRTEGADGSRAPSPTPSSPANYTRDSAAYIADAMSLQLARSSLTHRLESLDEGRRLPAGGGREYKRALVARMSATSADPQLRAARRPRAKPVAALIPMDLSAAELAGRKGRSAASPAARRGAPRGANAAEGSAASPRRRSRAGSTFRIGSRRRSPSATDASAQPAPAPGANDLMVSPGVRTGADELRRRPSCAK